MSNDNEQIIEDVEEEDLVVESEVEVSEETEVTEQEQPLSDTVLEVLLGEAKKKTEAEESEEDEEVSEEEEDEDEELEEAKASKKDEEESDEDEEEVSEAAEEESEEESDEDEEEVSEAAEEESDEEDEVKEEEESDEDEEEVSEAAEEEEESDEVEEEESDEDEEEVELPEVKTKAGILAASFDALKGMKKSNLVAAYEAINMTEDEEDEVEVPKTKADIINAMYGQLKSMKKDDIAASYKSIMASCGGMHEETEADSFALDLKVLAEADQELTEDFKAKASILFEAAVANKVNTIQEELESQYTEDLQEEVTYVRESLVEKIDDYLSFVVESWIEENQEFVDNKLRTEITENFMKALQSTFTEHYIEVPDSKVDLVDELSEQVTEIKESLANAEAEKSELASQVVTLQREKIISEASTDLASTEAGKLSSLVEDTEFVDADTFSAKVATIKEGFFKESNRSEELVESQDSTVTETQTIVEGAVDPQAKLPKDMAKYVQHLSRFK